MMTGLTLDQVDREITTHTAEFESLSAALVELDTHAGLEHIRRYPPAGTTLQRWQAIEVALGQMWEGLRWMTSILDAVRALRARSSSRRDEEVAELARLLREPSLTVTPEGISLDRPAGAGIGGSVESVGLRDTADRIRAAYPAVAEFLSAVDEIGTRVAKGLAPQINHLDHLGAPVPPEITDLLAASAVDPLAFSTLDIDDRIRAIARRVDVQSAQIAEDAALQSNWTEAVAETRAQLDVLREALQEAEHCRSRAERMFLTSPLPTPMDAENGLRDELSLLTEPDPATLRSLRSRIADAIQGARDNRALAVGLIDRRSELKGRLEAYQAKAARLGLAEDRDLLASSSIAVGLLSRNPCDLRAVTRAVTDFQQLIAQKRGTT